MGDILKYFAFSFQFFFEEARYQTNEMLSSGYIFLFQKLFVVQRFPTSELTCSKLG